VADTVVLLDHRIDPSELARLVKAHFEDMVKYVVDVERRLIAIGGDMHVDGEQLGNRTMEVQDPTLREKVREITCALVGEGEGLP
jgi:hypothetical protein